MSDSARPHRRQPTRLPRPWDSPGKNTGVGCHFLLQCMNVKSESEVTQSCPTLRDPMDCSPPGSSVHGIFQARVLEWGAIAFSMWLPSHVFLTIHSELQPHCVFLKHTFFSWNLQLCTCCSFCSIVLDVSPPQLTFVLQNPDQLSHIFSLEQNKGALFAHP